MVIHERGRHWHNYLELGIGFTMKVKSYEDHGEIEEWEIKAKNIYKKGYTVNELIEFLKELEKSNDLKYYTENKKDLVVIYTDNLEKIRGFLRRYITEEFENLYVQVMDFFEFRDITKWKDLHNLDEIVEYAQYLVDNLFLPDKYFYLTPNQIPRRKLKKAYKNSIESTQESIFPNSYDQYKLIRKALYGGICYVPYKNLIITDKIICLDLKSAYIYDLLIEKHCSSKLVLTNEENYEFYLESNSKTSIGSYKIKYKANTNKIHCFKDLQGNNFEKGEFEVNTILTNIDLKTLIELCDEITIKCYWLYECELDYLPKYLRDEIIKQYTLKEQLKYGNEEDYNRQKSVVNGIFGDCIRKYKTEKMFYDMQKTPYLAPQWGIWCTSYAKKNLLALALKVKGWVYSDTDSVYCFDTPENRWLVEKYNIAVRNKIKEFCELFYYDYEILKNLGTFEIEKEIAKFRAITQKVYMYETIDGEFKLTAAGLDQKTITVNKDLFEKEKLDYGSRTFKFVTNDSYYEKTLSGEDMIVMTICKSNLLDEQY